VPEIRRHDGTNKNEAAFTKQSPNFTIQVTAMWSGYTLGEGWAIRVTLRFM